MAAEPIPIILDCDPGHDDAIALLLALASPEVELLGDWIEESYRIVAPKRLVSALDAAH